MASGAADGLFRPIFEGSISGFDHCVERRPYHRNCSCELHNKSRNGGGGGTCTHKLGRGNNVSYPMRRAWSEGSLIMVASSAHSSPSSPAAAAASSFSFRNHHLGSLSVDLETREQHD